METYTELIRRKEDTGPKMERFIKCGHKNAIILQWLRYNARRTGE